MIMIGYARVSSRELQHEKLENSEMTHIFSDKLSSKNNKYS